MIILIIVALTLFITIPGTYLIIRARLASSLSEAACTGFFFGFALIALTYLGLSRFLPIASIDFLVVSTAAITAVLTIRELKVQRLPLWHVEPQPIQLLLVFAVMVFMLISAFGDLTSMIDDDTFMHLPNIKRAAMGDIPLHMAYFPDSYLRGHTARDLFIGTIARLMDTRPELALIYVTLAVCPAYVLTFYFLAQRLAEGKQISTCFGFFGLLFLVSSTIGAFSIKAGCLTFVWNNNAFAYSYVAYFAWLIQRILEKFRGSGEGTIISSIWTHKQILLLGTLSYASQYFIYISNFLMFSLFLVCLPALVFITAQSYRARYLRLSVVVVGLLIVGGIFINILISPLLIERVLVSLHIYHPSEPMGWLQQATLTVPKVPLFSITDTAGNDIRVFRRAFLLNQGFSFYVGLIGLFIGYFYRKPFIVATSFFGWLTMLWLMLVDMGEYRADTPRLILLAQIAFGATTGLLAGLLCENSIFLANATMPWIKWTGQTRTIQLWSIALLAGLSLWMARGTGEKFMLANHWDLATDARNMRKIIRRDPEDWHPRLNVRRIDDDTFRELARFMHEPNERVLVKLSHNAKLPGDGDEHNKIAHLVNLSCLTGAGIVGVCQEHAPNGIGRKIFPYDCRASLFWQRPSSELLQQLAPNWIIVDPAIVSTTVMATISKLPGIQRMRTLTDEIGNQRFILIYRGPRFDKPNVPLNIDEFSLVPNNLRADRYALTQSTATTNELNSERTKPPKVAMEVFDDKGQLANIMDAPIVGITRLDKNRYTLYFSMVQVGHWNVFFIDPATGRRLNKIPLKVSVDETKLADALSVSM